jgi:hypothetical protein
VEASIDVSDNWGNATMEASVLHLSENPDNENVCITISVWQMKRKRIPPTGEISKYKARRNVDGSSGKKNYIMKRNMHQ